MVNSAEIFAEIVAACVAELIAELIAASITGSLVTSIAAKKEAAPLSLLVAPRESHRRNEDAHPCFLVRYPCRLHPYALGSPKTSKIAAPPSKSVSVLDNQLAIPTGFPTRELHHSGSAATPSSPRRASEKWLQFRVSSR